MEFMTSIIYAKLGLTEKDIYSLLGVIFLLTVKLAFYVVKTMSDFKKMHHDIDLTRRELKNIRQELIKQKVNLNLEVSKIKDCISQNATETGNDQCCNEITKEEAKFPVLPIGFIHSCFNNKNGIPRQPSLCPDSKATLTIEKSLFTNPEHSLIGLEEFSHIWVIFVFHKNGEHSSVKAKVHPPRLNGASTGVFSTRSPHRPSPLGLSLIKLDKVEGSTLFLSGIDLLDGTPVLDIKPYIPLYDTPKSSQNTEESTSESHSNLKIDDAKSTCGIGEAQVERDSFVHDKTQPKFNCSVPPHLREIQSCLDVIFTNRAMDDLENFHAATSHDAECDNCFSFASTPLEAKRAIISVLQNDPRSVYRRQKCSDRLYYFSISNLHVTCWYDENIVEVLRIKSTSD